MRSGLLHLQRKMGLVVGLGGVTCAGKTTQSELLQKAFPKLVVFNQDDYFYDEDYEEHLRDSKGLINWDCSNAFDMKRLRGDIVDSKIANDLTCVEGITILPDLNDLLDLKFFLTLTEAECKERRQHRTYLGVPDPPGYFDEYLWPEYLKILEATEKLKDSNVIFIDCNKEEPSVIQERIVRELRNMIKSNENAP